MAAQASPALVRPPAALPAAADGAAKAEAERAAKKAEEARWKPVLEFSCALLVELPLPDFTIADLLKLRTGSVIDAHWRAGHDLPLRLNGALIAWSELEVLGDRLAVRLTELA